MKTSHFFILLLPLTGADVLSSCRELRGLYQTSQCCDMDEKTLSNVYYNTTDGKDTVALYQKFQPKIPSAGMPDKSSMCSLQIAEDVTLGATLNQAYAAFGFQCEVALNFSTLVTVDDVFNRLKSVSNVRPGYLLMQSYNDEEHTLFREYTFKSWDDFEREAISPAPPNLAYNSVSWKLMVAFPFIWPFNLVEFGFKVPQHKCNEMKTWLANAKISWTTEDFAAPALFPTIYTSTHVWNSQTVTCYDPLPFKSNDNRVYP